MWMGLRETGDVEEFQDPQEVSSHPLVRAEWFDYGLLPPGETGRKSSAHFVEGKNQFQEVITLLGESKH